MREALFMSRGDLTVFVSSPIAITIWVLVFLVMVPQLKNVVFKKRLLSKQGG